VKGILLAGGLGTRLFPLTQAVNKHLLPVYDKPLIFYPLSTAMLAGCSEIAVVTHPNHVQAYKRLLGNGHHLGLRLTYIPQTEAKGIAHGLSLCRSFAADAPFFLILGDNVFHGADLGGELRHQWVTSGGHIFVKEVPDISHYGALQLDEDGDIAALVEKPVHGGQGWAVTGMYFYGPDVWSDLETLSPSSRGELEITDLNQVLLETGRLKWSPLSRGSVWLDAGSSSSLAEASEYVAIIERRQGQLVGAPEEIAWRSGWISDADLRALLERFPDSAYTSQLRSLLG
jgi:glucose-1-phosphate thymidylyltransferase